MANCAFCGRSVGAGNTYPLDNPIMVNGREISGEITVCFKCIDAYDKALVESRTSSEKKLKKKQKKTCILKSFVIQV